MTSHVACLFPAFAMRQREFRRADFAGYVDIVEHFEERAAKVVELHRAKFDAPDDILLPDVIENDLQTQYACYIDNCAAAEWLRRRFPPCDYVAGYSMGLFAALCHSGAMTFEDGLRLVREVCVIAHEVVTGGPYGMGAVIGFTRDELATVISSTGAVVEVTDVCGPRVFVLSGTQQDIETTLAACLKSGALSAKPIPAPLPFHSSWLCAAEPKIRDLVCDLPIASPRCGIVSATTQQVLTTSEDVRAEVAGNVGTPLNWSATMHKLLDLGTDVFLECGLSDALTNLANRNVKGRYTIYNLRQVERSMHPPSTG